MADKIPTKKYGTIPEWCADSGMGRTSTYAALGLGNIRARKNGKRTLIDYESGFAYLDSLPAAEIRRPSERRAWRDAPQRDAAGKTPAAPSDGTASRARRQAGSLEEDTATT
jgi:hypothetical protein